ncbi:MAG: hypothetical protein R3C52_08880 [Hyphomonadaceae bacterium]
MGESSGNPERRLNAPIYCVVAGCALLFMGWLLGVGGAISAAFGGETDDAPVQWSLQLVGMALVTGIGGLLVGGGVLWMIISLVFEGLTRDDPYKDVDR